MTRCSMVMRLALLVRFSHLSRLALVHRHSHFLQHRGMYADDPRSRSDDTAPRTFPITNYVRLPTVGAILDALYRHGPVWFGNSVDKGIFTPYYTNFGWVVPPPNGRPIGGHAIAACGFWISHGWLLIKNSWGVNWGDSGYAWLPLTHFVNYPNWDAWLTTDAPDNL